MITPPITLKLIKILVSLRKRGKEGGRDPGGAGGGASPEMTYIMRL